MPAPKGGYRDPELREHFVYKAFGPRGQLLYVGCTRRLEKRYREHLAAGAPWLTKKTRFRLVGPLPYEAARAIEREVIRTEGPQFNFTPDKARSRRRGHNGSRVWAWSKNAKDDKKACA